MAGSWFAGLGQTIAGAIATAATFAQVEAVNNWTAEGAKMLSRILTKLGAQTDK